MKFTFPFLIIGIVVLATQPLWADLPPPPNATAKERAAWRKARAERDRMRFASPRVLQQPESVPVTKQSNLIVKGENITGVYLTLPRGLVQQLQAKTSSSGTWGTPTSSWTTIVAGIALSLAFATGGLWLVRSRRRMAFGGVAFSLLVMFCVMGGSCLHPDRGWNVRDHTFQSPPMVRLQNGELTGEVVYQIGQDDNVGFTLDQTLLARFLQQGKVKLKTR